MSKVYVRTITESVGRVRRLKLILWCVGAVTVATISVACVAAPYIVDGISMRPTLRTNDMLLVWRVPKTWAWLTRSQWIPLRGSVVVIGKAPVSGETLVKRVIGVPGDTVSIAGGKVTIYNTQHPQGFNPDTAPYGKHLAPVEGTYSTQVQPGQVFVLGDNRTQNSSLDSRSSIGNIPVSVITGEVALRFYPFNRVTSF